MTVRVQREVKQRDTSKERVLSQIRTPKRFVTAEHVRRSGCGGGVEKCRWTILRQLITSVCHCALVMSVYVVVCEESVWRLKW